ncbi:UDP-N-acetylmuramoyl-L-alanyl-D-glutamate--2,6-diaminopimelate ligase [Bacillus sp. J14TS2]|uniref:UDP-N-acetylmuramoyl-L-alanyl-D-glutamate--2, 6-diaminopimelate ligase n=1 Tax=Bacillus sp. J14TS2 TaxID=2807188 RepID=UPI001B0CB266|nr:UDP-N-acetylmuramoyl-L-alanyl-D-glutamate--2,6-diaminopimelate ligase [Bacillus sp. J14TS2]GIN72873.1 UDP-N-acetylmuramoyl-L-alanyl-D-glutamate--2,6-diaminopimelate ligase [Bacillus sp. J14TS2]
MLLKEIASLFLVKSTSGNLDIEITGLQMDSRKVEKGNLFICVPGIKGFLEDRHLYAQEAIKNGAVALVVERDVDSNVPKIFVKDARHAMAMIASHFYNYPSHEMKLIGITGTNGKTTTSYMIESIFSDYGLTMGLMGNNGIKMNGNMYPTDINTQESPILQRNLRQMRDYKTEYCVMEVTSQGIDMKRVMGCNFRTAIFTNLTQDHLDYHGTFENYRHTKSLLFSSLGNSFNNQDKKYAVLNADDSSFKYFSKVTSAEVITYGINNESDVSAENITMSSQGIRFLLITFKGDIEIDMKLVGRFNIYNALAAITAALLEGIPLENIRNSLSQIASINGRMEIVDEGQNFLVLVDYAHTPDALENVLKTIKEFTIGRIITVFGCGGDRDATKRPIMGRIASEYSDIVYVTSDNPRSEDPNIIMNDIEEGLKRGSTLQYELFVDRKEAIYKAIKTAKKNDVVIIAGKGHETYQIFQDKTIEFNDKEIAQKFIQEIQML